MSVRQKKQELLEAMHRARAMEPSSFVPNKLLDTLIQRMQLKNDAELCRVLEVQPPIISKIRHRKLNVGATILLRLRAPLGFRLASAETVGEKPMALAIDADQIMLPPGATGVLDLVTKWEAKSS